MIKDFTTYINEGLFDRNQSEFAIRKTDKGIEQVYVPKTKKELYDYIDIDIEQAKKDGTYPDVNLNNIDVSELGSDDLNGLFCDDIYSYIILCISNWNIEYIPSNFFSNSRQIKKFIIPNSVTSIGENAFRWCINLTSIEIPNSVKIIGDSAFKVCTGLTYIDIPDSVESIGMQAFYSSGLTSIEIPNSVTSIGKSAFEHCDELTSVTIPNSVTRIEYRTFSICSNLKYVTIPNSVTSIGNCAFYWCDSLESVTIPKHCNIESDSFPEECKIIRRDD